MSALIIALDGEKNLVVRKLHQTPRNSSTPSSDVGEWMQAGLSTVEHN